MPRLDLHSRHGKKTYFQLLSVLTFRQLRTLGKAFTSTQELRQCARSYNSYSSVASMSVSSFFAKLTC